MIGNLTFDDLATPTKKYISVYTDYYITMSMFLLYLLCTNTNLSIFGSDNTIKFKPRGFVLRGYMELVSVISFDGKRYPKVYDLLRAFG